MTPSLSQDAFLTALRLALLAMMPDGVEAIVGQDNRVPMPAASDFIVMTPARRDQMSSTSHEYDSIVSVETVSRSTGVHIQIDVYGPAAADNVQTITTLMRDAWGVAMLRPYGIGVLYCDDPRQMPLLTGEQQYLQRWMTTIALHANIDIVVPAAFAATLITTLSEADR